QRKREALARLANKNVHRARCATLKPLSSTWRSCARRGQIHISTQLRLKLLATIKSPRGTLVPPPPHYGERGATMKIPIACALVIAGVVVAFAQLLGQSELLGTGSNPHNYYVSPYVNSHGTMVQVHWQTNTNSTPLGNHSTRASLSP